MIGFSRRSLAALALSAMVPAGAGAQGPTDRLAGILARGELRVGVWLGTPPWGYRLDSGEMDGTEVELARRIASLLDLRLELVPLAFNERVTAVVLGYVDLLCATLVIQPDRLRQVAFAHSHGSFVVALGTHRNRPFGRIRDIGSRPIIGLEEGASIRAAIDAFPTGAQVIAVPDYLAALDAYRQDPDTVLALPDFALRRAILEQPDLQLEFRRNLVSAAYAIAIQQGQPDLLRLINTLVFLMDQDGTLSEIHERHAGAPRPGQARL